MGILDKIVEKAGTSSLKVDMKVLDRHIIHREPFNVRVDLEAVDKDIKISGLTVELVWEESRIMTYQDGYGGYTPANRINYEQKIIQRAVLKEQHVIKQGKKRSLELAFNTEKARYIQTHDKLYLKLHVDVPGKIDVRKKMLIEVLPELPYCFPVMFMRDDLGFLSEFIDLGFGDTGNFYYWKLLPPEGSHEHIEYVILSVCPTRKVPVNIYLSLYMCERPGCDDRGIHEEMSRTFELEHDNFSMGLIVQNITKMLDEAESDFKEILRL